MDEAQKLNAIWARRMRGAAAARALAELAAGASAADLRQSRLDAERLADENQRLAQGLALATERLAAARHIALASLIKAEPRRDGSLRRVCRACGRFLDGEAHEDDCPNAPLIAAIMEEI